MAYSLRNIYPQLNKGYNMKLKRAFMKIKTALTLIKKKKNISDNSKGKTSIKNLFYLMKRINKVKFRDKPFKFFRL